MRRRSVIIALSGAALTLGLVGAGLRPVSAGQPTYDINTLAGKVAAVEGTPGLHLHMSGLIKEEAGTGEQGATAPYSSSPITPAYVLSSPLDGTKVLAPDVTVNRDTAAAPQNETAIAVDPNDASRVVAGANDYVTRTWTCTISGTPCSALGDGYSGTYFSNNGGSTWCCVATDPSHIGTLIPGVEHLVGGQYDAGGDPALAFDSRGHVYYAGLGFDRTAAPNTVTVNQGTFSGSGSLTWGPPTFIDATTSPAVFNDKEWIAADANSSSPFRDRVYVTWTRFIFNPATGAYVQSPIDFAYSTNGGSTFSSPQLIAGNVINDQGSRPVVGPDGTLYVFWDGSTRLATLDSTWMVKSTDGGASWSKPVAVSPLVDISPLANTAFRVNSFPAAAVAPNGTLYAAWTTEARSTTSLTPDPACFAGPPLCRSVAVYSTSTDGGAIWTPPAAIFSAAPQTAIGYPVKQPDGSTLNAPSPLPPVEDVFPAVAVSPLGDVYMSAYRADVVSPWQTCAAPATPTAVGRVDCLTLGPYVNNSRLDYVVSDLTTVVTNKVTTQPVNSRYQFGGSFIGDYTDIAVGSDGTFHALWTDTNNVQTVVWWYGFQFVPTSIHQQDVVTASGNF